MILPGHSRLGSRHVSDYAALRQQSARATALSSSPVEMMARLWLSYRIWIRLKLLQRVLADEIAQQLYEGGFSTLEKTAPPTSRSCGNELWASVGPRPRVLSH